jgi:SAM-dependent methyltransferase
MLRKSAPMLVALRGLASAFSPFRNLGGKPVPFAPMPGFPASAVGVADVLAAPKWPAEWPYSPRDFTRGDESPDPYFYDQPRFCFHVDDAAVGALTEFYGTALREWDKPAILDICASHVSYCVDIKLIILRIIARDGINLHAVEQPRNLIATQVSHFPADIADFAGNRVALGMNEEELKNNTQVDSYVVKDLNEDPTLPFEDNSFDVVTNVVSIDYLTKPLAICKEIRRVLKPGGQAVMALSNRCFPSKAVDIWLRTNDLEHVFVVGSYFHYAGGFKAPSAVEVSPNQAQTPWAGGRSQNVAYLAVVRTEVDK